MARGGKREGAGRPANPERKIGYGIKLKPEHIEWLKTQKRGFAAKLFEDAVDAAMKK